MEPGFIKGSAENLPKVDFTMVDEFYMSNMDYLSAEVKNIKTKRSTRHSYVDNAVAYVQVKRDGPVCVVKGRITPEHRVHKKNYNVIMKVEEQEEKVLLCKCLDCSASAGGCKHAVAFLMWVHRRSEEPSVTSQDCYWRKSALSKSVKETKIMDLQALTALTFKEDNNSITTADDFIEFMKHTMTDIDCQRREFLTRDQSKSTAWYELRFGRITASRLFQASRCQTTDGALMEKNLGATRPFITEPIRRGLLLEEEVLKEVGQLRKLKIQRCGLLLDKDFPCLVLRLMDSQMNFVSK
ncbi:hypothetical protein NQ315_013492 [Exocentrus adspersus]|uniref:SWIM-type domain-containing protein n=1 Tax=Exocentrus adspersus TaxID=1586481 RepID=A0AAV8V8L4_9CUCU|nr:hypothetical protein NQ315_013492 [Exocentrus adspersus]